MKICPYNNSECDSESCAGCGWDPDEHDDRKKRIASGAGLQDKDGLLCLCLGRKKTTEPERNEQLESLWSAIELSRRDAAKERDQHE